MSFKSFLELAQKNQDLNDNIVKKLSEEQKKKKELYLKERKAIEEANKAKKRIKSYVPPSFSTTNIEYVPSPIVDNTDIQSNNTTEVARQRSGTEYVPTPIPKPKKLSSLMDALEEINGEIPFAEKRFKIKTKIPKLGGSIPSTSNIQNNPESKPSNSIPISNPKSKSDDAVSLQLRLPKMSKVSSPSATEVLPKPGMANQQSISSKKIGSLSASKSVNKPSLSSSAMNRSNSSSRGSIKPAPSKTTVIPPQRESHVRFTPKQTSNVQNHSSSRNSLPNKAPNGTEKYIPSSTASHNRDHVRAVPCKTSSTSPLKHVSSSTSAKPFPSDGLRKINSIRSPLTTSTPNFSKPSNSSRGIAAQYGLVPTAAAGAIRQFKSPYPKCPPSTNTISKPQHTSHKQHAEPPKRTASQPPKNGIPQKRPTPNPLRPVPTQISRPSQPSNNQPIVRGIAAQLGVLPPNDSYLDNDSDEYESDDSFIDDSDCTSAKEYKLARNEIYKTLHFDPKKYAKVSKYDDLSSMESSYRQIEKEEKLSLRLGAQEDKEDMAWEEERRRKRMEKLK